MAAGRFIVGPYFPARNRDGVLQAGALLYVYENGTTTKATIYTDEGLSVLSPNPVTANSSGQFPPVWGEAGTESVPVPYTVQITAADGSSLGNPSTFDDFYPSLNWENAATTLAEAAAVAAEASADAAATSETNAAASAAEATADLVAIEEIAAGSPDAPSILNKANKNADNVSAYASDWRSAIGVNAAADTADVDAGNVAPYASDWLTAIGAGSQVETDINTADNAYALTRKPSKTLARLFSSATSASNLKVLILGDSLGASKYIQLAANLNNLASGVAGVSPNTSGSLSGTGTPTGGASLAISASSGVTQQTGQYAQWFNGLVNLFASGATSTWQEGGASPTWTNIYVDYIREPGAGTIDLLVGGVSVGTTSANGVSSFERITYSKAYGQASVQVNVSGASVRIINVHVDRPSRRGVDLYNLSVGGMTLATALADPVAVSRLGQFLADFNPDLIFFEMDDNFGSEPGSAAWNTLADTMDANIPYTDKIIIASSPRLADNAGKIASRDFLRTECYDRGQSYLFFDGYTIFGSYAQMTDTFGANDGVHPPASAQNYAAEMLWQTLGFNAFNTGYVPKAVNYTGGPSYFGRGTTFGDDPFGNTALRGILRANSDSSFGLDWRLEVSRSLSVTDLSANATGWVFSTNTGVVANQIPATARVGSSTGPFVPRTFFGTATLVAGTVTVANANVATGDKIWVSCNTPGGTQGFLSAPVASIVNSTSFVINSSNAADTSTVNWMIVR